MTKKDMVIIQFVFYTKIVNNKGARMKEIRETKLKPCPFCGSEAEIESFTAKVALFKKATGKCITCKSCKCRTPVVFEEENAIEIWNRRV